VLGSARMTRQGNVVGTIEYMSPEAVRGLEVDARSDVYSLGILLYEMLTGRVPFDSTSEFEMMKMQVEQAPQPPRTFTANIPIEVEQAIMRALAKKPVARFQTAGEFRAMLLGALGKATNELPLHTAIYSAPATRAMEIPFGGETQALTAEGDAMRGSTRIVGSPTDAASTFQKQNKETQEAAAPPLPGQSSDAPPASTPASTVVVNKFTGETPHQVAKTQIYQTQPPAIQTATPVKGRFNWKHYTAAAALLVVLIGGTLALVMSRSAKPAPAPEPTEPSASEPASPAAPVDSAAPSTNANSNEALTPANAGSLIDATNTNANANTSKSARARANRNENSNTTATAETPAQPEEKPAQAEPPPQTPAPEAKTAEAQGTNKNAGKPDEKKKKGGIGGFFKKVFGGGDDKKKEESKNKKP
jgi:hypothetical protein